MRRCVAPPFRCAARAVGLISGAYYTIVLRCVGAAEKGRTSFVGLVGLECLANPKLMMHYCALRVAQPAGTVRQKWRRSAGWRIRTQANMHVPMCGVGCGDRGSGMCRRGVPRADRHYKGTKNSLRLVRYM